MRHHRVDHAHLERLTSAVVESQEKHFAGSFLADLASQVRAGFYGEEVQRVQRGQDEVKVMVRYPGSERRSLADVEGLRIRLEDGTAVPFASVVPRRISSSTARPTAAAPSLARSRDAWPGASVV